MTEILILDFNRPKELKSLLESLKAYALFDKKIVVLNNGGERYADKFKEEGLCDFVINNNVNAGCGLATIQLFAQCSSDFAFYVQVDHRLVAPINQQAVSEMENMIENGYFYIDLAGDQCQGKYSERAQFMKRENYFKARLSAGGPGPLEDLKWTEESMQDHIKEKGLQFHSVYNPPFADCGWSSVRTNPDGSIWKHHPDTKELWLVKGPIKEKFSYPKFTDEEWDKVIKEQFWEDGKIPSKEKEHSFKVGHWNAR